MVTPLKVPQPMKMLIAFKLTDINNRKIEHYEFEVMIKKDSFLKDSMHNLKVQLDHFCNECEGTLDAIVKHQLKL